MSADKKKILATIIEIKNNRIIIVMRNKLEAKSFIQMSTVMFIN